eukprot:365300-Chlamydomonas_euryale.AAC.20
MSLKRLSTSFIVEATPQSGTNVSHRVAGFKATGRADTIYFVRLGSAGTRAAVLASPQRCVNVGILNGVAAGAVARADRCRLRCSGAAGRRGGDAICWYAQSCGCGGEAGRVAQVRVLQHHQKCDCLAHAVHTPAADAQQQRPHLQRAHARECGRSSEDKGWASNRQAGDEWMECGARDAAP